MRLRIASPARRRRCGRDLRVCVPRRRGVDSRHAHWNRRYRNVRFMIFPAGGSESEWDDALVDAYRQGYVPKGHEPTHTAQDGFEYWELERIPVGDE